MPNTAAENRSFDCRVFQTIQETLEIGNNPIHNVGIIFCRCCNEVEFFVLHFCIRTTATVDHDFHLSAHGIKVNRSGHHDYIGSQHLLNDFGCIIFLRARLVVLAANTASQTRMDSLVAQENLFHFVPACQCAYRNYRLFEDWKIKSESFSSLFCYKLVPLFWKQKYGIYNSVLVSELRII